MTNMLYKLDQNFCYSGIKKQVVKGSERPIGWIRTNQEPPEPSQGDVVKWVGGEWVLAPAQLTQGTLQGPRDRDVLTVLQLRRLFTFEEKVAVEEAILAGNSALKVFMDDLAVATEVDLSDPLVAQGLDILIASEIITEERKQQILNNEALE